MLEQLKLQNLALAVQAEVDMTAGMICITGETGAGKSLVVDALALALGAKADSNMVRQGERQLEVSALFDITHNSKAKALLTSYGFMDGQDVVEEGDSDIDSEASFAGVDVVADAASEASVAADASIAAETGVATDAGNEADTDAGAGANSSIAAATGDDTDYAQSSIVIENGQVIGAISELGDSSDMPSVEGDKSIKMVAMSDNGNAQVVLTDTPQCAVVADGQAMDISAVSPMVFKGDNIPSCEVILRRVVSCEGKSKGYINGHMATLSQMRELSECLVAIHGQHASVRLMDEKYQLDIVDNYGKLKALVSQVNGAYNNYISLRDKLTKLSDEQKRGAQEYRQDRYDLEELKRLALGPGDYEDIESRFDKAMNQAQFSFALDSLRQVVDIGEHSISAILRERLIDLEKVKLYDSRINTIQEHINAALISLDEAVGIIDQITATDMEMSTTDLERIMNKIHFLSNHFACAPKDLYLQVERIENKVATFIGLKDKIEECTAEVKEARQRYEEIALALTSARKAVASELAMRITEKIKALALPDARFEIVLNRDEEGKPRLNGRDNLCFMFSANLGQDPRPLAAVASGGELSRLALTIEVLTASVKSTPTLIFDEVDTGISGRTAAAVGALLKELGSYVQVLTVTHLPQVAACADTQFVVAKYNADGQVNSTIKMLDDNGRVEEISRMIGGEVITENTRRSAYELLHANVS